SERSAYHPIMHMSQIGGTVLDGQEYEHEEEHEYDRRFDQHAAQVIQMLDKRCIRVLDRHFAPPPGLFISVVADGLYRLFSLIVLFIPSHHGRLLFPYFPQRHIRKRSYLPHTTPSSSAQQRQPSTRGP